MRYLKLFDNFSQNFEQKVENIIHMLPTSKGLGETWTNSSLKEFKNEKSERFNIKIYYSNFYKLKGLYDNINWIRRYALKNDIKFFILKPLKGDVKNRHIIILCDNSTFDSLNFVHIERDGEYDIFFEKDFIVRNKDNEDYETIYETESLLVTRPKTVNAVLKCAADTKNKFAFRNQINFIRKHLNKGSYYAGYNWYREKEVKSKIRNWWRSLVNLPDKEKIEKVKEFEKSFPRYLIYVVEYKYYSHDNPFSKLILVYDISRSEEGKLPYNNYSSISMMTGRYWGDKLDSSHNQLMIYGAGGDRLSLKEIHSELGASFRRPFSIIEEEVTKQKEALYNMLGVWGDIGGEYSDDALVFTHTDKGEFRVVHNKDIITHDNGIRFKSLGDYKNPDFDYWRLNEPKPKDKKIPEGGYKDFYDTIRFGVEHLVKNLDDK